MGLTDYFRNTCDSKCWYDWIFRFLFRWMHYLSFNDLNAVECTYCKSLWTKPDKLGCCNAKKHEQPDDRTGWKLTRRLEKLILRRWTVSWLDHFFNNVIVFLDFCWFVQCFVYWQEWWRKLTNRVVINQNYPSTNHKITRFFVNKTNCFPSCSPVSPAVWTLRIWPTWRSRDITSFQTASDPLWRPSGLRSHTHAVVDMLQMRSSVLFMGHLMVESVK